MNGVVEHVRHQCDDRPPVARGAVGGARLGDRVTVLEEEVVHRLDDGCLGLGPGDLAQPWHRKTIDAAVRGWPGDVADVVGVEVTGPAGELQQDAIGVLEVHRSHEDTVMELLAIPDSLSSWFQTSGSQSPWRGGGLGRRRSDRVGP